MFTQASVQWTDVRYLTSLPAFPPPHHFPRGAESGCSQMITRPLWTVWIPLVLLRLYPLCFAHLLCCLKKAKMLLVTSNAHQLSRCNRKNQPDRGNDLHYWGPPLKWPSTVDRKCFTDRGNLTSVPRILSMPEPLTLGPQLESFEGNENGSLHAESAVKPISSNSKILLTACRFVNTEN